jgi:hypothetical protein
VAPAQWTTGEHAPQDGVEEAAQAPSQAADPVAVKCNAHPTAQLKLDDMRSRMAAGVHVPPTILAKYCNKLTKT